MNTEQKRATTLEHLDVLIVGAGISGICTAYYLQTRCPQKSFALFEGREAIGGTWDLFQYPGVRSDSDMYTLGYSFRPWQDPKVIADGPAILKYVRETAAEYGIDQKIRFKHRVRNASWSSADSLWTVEAVCGPDQEVLRFTCNFLCMCTGYYDYDQGYTPVWPGIEQFTGRLIHPQKWPADLDYAGKQVLVIGSGATAVTLVPAMAEQAAHVTMLQRSPTYIVARPSNTRGLRHALPARLAYGFARWQAILFGIYFYGLTRRRPEAAKQALLRMAREQLDPDYDFDTHFAPKYNPWDQRLCLAPDGDFFAAIRGGKVTVVTDQIETFTEKGLRLRSGQELTADIIVTATGLTMKIMSGVQLVVDGAPVDLSKTFIYRGTMYRDIPNLASALGYTNASWTLKCELIARYICRLLNYMDRHAYTQSTPRLRDTSPLDEEPMMGLTSGYMQRAKDTLPRQSSRKPWTMYQNYLRDLISLRFNTVSDGTMEFTHRSAPTFHKASGKQEMREKETITEG
ncbi:MAG TPA: NAD(P)/FAD-dependent oxidoreductase [Ktedonobacteraceae bacterium]|nr:NAD(P)/FAD-dependent oxidoreductase [Ktedonobacteraceae bacterium]